MRKDKKQDLIDIETKYFTLVIKGKPIHPTVEEFTPFENDTKAEIRLALANKNQLESFKYYHPEKGMLKTKNHFIKSYPVFYEEQEYDIYIEGNEEKIDQIEFYHQDQNISQAINHPPRNKRNLYGSINFGSDIGLSELEIRAGKSLLFTLTIEVFPSKIDYRNDYNRLLNEVNEEVYNLAYDFLRKTYQNMKPKEASEITDAEFYIILRTIYNDFIKAFKRVKNSPHHRLITKKRVKPSARVKKVNRKSVKWLNKNSHYYDKKSQLPEKMIAFDKQISYDTFENKFVKWIFKRLIKKLNHFEKIYKKSKRNPDSKIFKEVRKMKRQLERHLKDSFLKEVGELYKIDSISLVLQMAPGYRELYKYYLILLKGLSLNGEIFQLSMKQLWELYEYWTFLKINRILSDEYELIKQDIVELNYSGITVTLSKSKEATVKYKNPNTGEKFFLHYNSFLGDTATTRQRPDNILSLEKENSEVDYKFIFDAKYRVNPAYKGSSYANKYNGIPGPEEDTINTMHRYRDAISTGDDNQFARTMVGAYVLFPYQDQEKFRQHQFYQSIDKVNVGAFPFLPGSTELLAEFLENIIGESAISNYSRNLLPKGTSEFRPEKDFNRNVLVGSLSKKSQLKFVLENNIYYMPFLKSVMGKELKYIAIFQSKNKFDEESGVKYFAEIKDIEVVKRKEIDFPSSRSKEDKRYILFHLKKWRELSEVVKAEGYGVSGSHIYTNDMLLKKADTLPELSIKTIREWRVWLELKRMKKEIKVKLKNNNLNDLESINGFTDGEITVEVKDDKLISKDKKWNYNQFLRNPRGVLKELIEE